MGERDENQEMIDERQGTRERKEKKTGKTGKRGKERGEVTETRDVRGKRCEIQYRQR